MKNFQFILLATIAVTFAMPCYAAEIASPAYVNQLTAEEKSQGWTLLFNGKDTGRWRGFNRRSLPGGWDVSNGTLHMKGVKNMSVSELESRGDIIYPESYQNFILKLEWKISAKGNSGIFYLGREDASFDYIWRAAPEMQILDNLGHPDANKGKNGNRQAGSLYDLIAASPQNAKAPGEWNQIEIRVNNRKVTHTQNGAVVVSYQLDTPEWQQKVALSKFPTLNPRWHQVSQHGIIGLQDHSDEVWFRNIKIKNLPHHTQE